MIQEPDNNSTWGYIYRHPLKVSRFPNEMESVLAEARVSPDAVFVPRYFIHKTIKAVKKHTTVREVEEITPIGFIFLHGTTTQLRQFLTDYFPQDHLINNPLTGVPAEIPNSQMNPFMQLINKQPERIKPLDNPISYFKQHPHIRITSGLLEGLEGYVVRVSGSRSLVIDIAGRSFAIKDILREAWETVE